jgi:hypothetical protein
MILARERQVIPGIRRLRAVFARLSTPLSMIAEKSAALLTRR